MTSLLVQWLVAGCLIAGVAVLIVRLVPQGAAAERHWLWWGTLAAVIAGPLIPISPFRGAPSAGPSAGVAAGGVPGAASLFTLPEIPAPGLLAAAWALIILIGLLRIATGLLTVRRLARRATPVAAVPDWPAAVQLPGRRRRAALAVSDDISGACAVGFVRPTILVSRALVSTLYREQLDAIVRHEQAHLDRYDDWTRLLQRLLLAIFGLHPAVRLVSRQIDVECEAACDQRVVAQTCEPLGYARALAAAASTIVRGRTRIPALVPGASIGGAGLHARVSRIVECAPVRPVVRWLASTSAAAGTALAVALALMLPPIASTAPFELPPGAVPARPLGVAPGFRPTDPPRSLLMASTTRPTVAPVPPIPAAATDMEPRPLVYAEHVAAAPLVTDLDRAPALAARPLPVALAPLMSASAEPLTRTGGIGERSAHGGNAVAAVSASAGRSIGRFFSRGARAVSDRF